MLAILFLFLALAAAKVTAWQLGAFSSFLGATGTAPDYTLASLSFTATLIFIGLALAGRAQRENAKSNI